MSNICVQCGYEGRGKKVLRGSKAMEIFIWAVLLVPGPLYSIRRRAGIQRHCPHCREKSMVRLKSDAGFIARQMLLKDIEAPPAPAGPLSAACIPPAQEEPPPAPPPPLRREKRVVDPDSW